MERVIDRTQIQHHLTRLLSRTAHGDQEAFAELYQQTSAHLFAFALRILKRRDWAEEALQDSYVQIWKHAADYQGQRGAPFTWMSVILRNRSLDILRKQRRETLQDPAQLEGKLEVVDSDNPSLESADLRQTEALGRCLETLEVGPKACIELAFWKGLSHAELAKAVGKPLGTVKSWVRRGLEKLKRCLAA